ALAASCAGAGAAVLLGGPLALPAGVAGAVATWVLASRIEPRSERRRREQVRRDLPHLVGLLGGALRSGQAPVPAIGAVARALPGPAADRLLGVAARLELGADPVALWLSLAGDPALAPLGRAMARAHRSGASAAAAVERLADDLAARGRADAEDRARAVGVRAAVPLGVCLLPSFLLLGIVPLVAGLARTLAW
ncbi:type II secretion system F family protein, partial [Nocardioides sp. YIM 152588]|uniref:type II secretion system F family protein n=1 Tax=Nocardioides sp. YIM 152588 TaxID=3158259 RepID=UPI0032E47628